MQRNLKKIIVLILISLFSLSGFSLAAENKTVAAKVNGKEIFKSEVDFYVGQMLQKAATMGQSVTPEQEQIMRDQWLDRVITKELLLQQAKADKIEVTEAEIKDSIEKMEQQGGKQNYYKFKKAAKENLLLKKLIENSILAKVIVTDKEIADFYNSKKEQMIQPAQIKARHILIKVAPTDSKDKKDAALKKIKGIYEKVTKENEDFAELAKKLSEGPSGPNGGDLGYFRQGQMVPPFDKTAFALKVGEVSQPVETRFGYHIIKLEDKKEGRVFLLEEVKDKIANSLKEEKGKKKFDKLVTELKEKSKIEIIK